MDFGVICFSVSPILLVDKHCVSLTEDEIAHITLRCFEVIVVACPCRSADDQLPKRKVLSIVAEGYSPLILTAAQTHVGLTGLVGFTAYGLGCTL